jgi:poly(3-hydroxyoctanoate) depolymerase
VLGVSFGGALAQQLVRQSPDRVRRLVLAATGPGIPGLGGVPGRPGALLTLVTPLRYYSPAYFRKVAPTLYGGRIRREPDLLAEQAHARISRPPSLRGYVGQLYAMWGWSNLPWLPFIRHPTLVMAGDDDPIMPLANGRILAKLIPLARLEVITGGGHLFLLEEAERSAALVREFLAERLDGT